jgi:hypothetical protein
MDIHFACVPKILKAVCFGTFTVFLDSHFEPVMAVLVMVL